MDGEEEAEQEEEAEDGGAADGGQDADGRAPGRVLRLFGEVGGRVEAGDGILREQDPADGDVGGRCSDGPTHCTVHSRAVVEVLEDL